MWLAARRHHDSWWRLIIGHSGVKVEEFVDRKSAFSLVISSYADAWEKLPIPPKGFLRRLDRARHELVNGHEIWTCLMPGGCCSRVHRMPSTKDRVSQLPVRRVPLRWQSDLQSSALMAPCPNQGTKPGRLCRARNAVQIEPWSAS